MPANKADIDIYQGTDWSATVLVQMSDGSPADITGWTAAAQLRRGPADVAPYVEQEITTVVQAPDTVILSIGHADTTLLTGRYSWDLDLQAPDGMITTVLYGHAIIQTEVTR